MLTGSRNFFLRVYKEKKVNGVETNGTKRKEKIIAG